MSFIGHPRKTFVLALSDAVLDCINSGVLCTNFTFVQITIVNCFSSAVFGAVKSGIVFANGLR